MKVVNSDEQKMNKNRYKIKYFSCTLLSRLLGNFLVLSFLHIKFMLRGFKRCTIAPMIHTEVKPESQLMTVYNYATKVRKCSTTYIYRLIKDGKIETVVIDGMKFVKVQ